VSLSLLLRPTLTIEDMQFRAAGSVNGDADMILGDTFLRNAYMLQSWGSFVRMTVPADPNALLQPGPPFNPATQPYVQLLALTTDAAKAHAEFVAARGRPAPPVACATGSGGLAPDQVMQRCQSLCANIMMLNPAVAGQGMGM
jgi:hypothetical protein